MWVHRKSEIRRNQCCVVMKKNRKMNMRKADALRRWNVRLETVMPMVLLDIVCKGILAVNFPTQNQLSPRQILRLAVYLDAANRAADMPRGIPESHLNLTLCKGIKA